MLYNPPNPLRLWKKLGNSLLCLALIFLIFQTSLAKEAAPPEKNSLPPAASTKVDFKRGGQPLPVSQRDRRQLADERAAVG